MHVGIQVGGDLADLLGSGDIGGGQGTGYTECQSTQLAASGWQGGIGGWRGRYQSPESDSRADGDYPSVGIC